MQHNSLIDLLEGFEHRQSTTLSMHASESPMSPATQLALAHDLSTRYSSDDPGNDLVPGDMIFGGSSKFDLLKEICTSELKRILNADYVSFKPLSGFNASDIMISTICKPGSLVFLVPNKYGGHPAFPEMLRNYDIRYQYIPFEKNLMDVDWSKLEQMIELQSPDLIYFDASDFLFQFRLDRFQKIRKSSFISVFDVSHVLGLVATKNIHNPLDFGFDAIIGSTHKSFPGPHKGIFGTRSRKLHERFEHCTKWKISSTHSHHILALTIALIEFKEYGRGYIHQILQNGNAFAEELKLGGLTPVSKEGTFTQTHQIWLPFPSYALAIQAFRNIERIGIYANFIKLHYDTGWGIRFGMQETTFRGFTETHSRELARLILKAVSNQVNAQQGNLIMNQLLNKVTPVKKSSDLVLNLLANYT